MPIVILGLRTLVVAFIACIAFNVCGDTVQRDSNESAIPFKAERSVVATSSPRLVIVTLLAIAAAVAVILVMKKRMRAKGVLSAARTHRIKIVEMRRVTTRTTVSILAVDDREYLLAQSGDAVQLIEHHSSIALQGNHEPQL